MEGSTKAPPSSSRTLVKSTAAVTETPNSSRSTKAIVASHSNRTPSQNASGQPSKGRHSGKGAWSDEKKGLHAFLNEEMEGKGWLPGDIKWQDLVQVTMCSCRNQLPPHPCNAVLIYLFVAVPSGCWSSAANTYCIHSDMLFSG